MFRLSKDILLDKPFKVKVEQISEFKDSFFKDVYIEAAENALKIISDTFVLEDNVAYKDSKVDFYDNIKDYNNIIAFTGDRGVGKTSAMISFVNALINFNNIKEIDLNESFIKRFIELNERCYFTSLQLIESTFEGNN